MGNSSTYCKSLREIGDTCNVTDRQVLRRSVEDHSCLIHTQYEEVKGKCVLVYSVPYWLREFLFHPNRSQCFYLTSWIIEECQGAMKNYILDPTYYLDLIFFFTPVSMQLCSGLTHANYLLESVGSGSDTSLLLGFLGFLSEIDWLDIYDRPWDKNSLANSIMCWVCTTLVS